MSLSDHVDGYLVVNGEDNEFDRKAFLPLTKGSSAGHRAALHFEFSMDYSTRLPYLKICLSIRLLT